MRCPRDDKATVAQTCDLWLELGRRGFGFDLQFRLDQRAGRVITVETDAVDRVVIPDNDPSAVSQPGDIRIELR